MKRQLLIFMILLAAGKAMTQSHVSDLVVTPAFSGGTIKWYTASSGANEITSPTTTDLVDGTTYYASQTVNGIESTARLDVTATVTIIPTAATHTSTETSITWNWNASANATGYKWSTTNDYTKADDLGNTLTVTQSGLTCNTSNSIYVWAYNASCNTGSVTLTKSTSPCFTVSSIDFANGTGGTSEMLDAGPTVQDYIQIVFSKEVDPGSIYTSLTKGATINVPGISFSGFSYAETFVMAAPLDWHIGTFGEAGTAITTTQGGGADPSVYTLTLSSDGKTLTMYLYNATNRTLTHVVDASNYLWYTPDSNIKAADGSSITGSFYREPNGSSQF